MTRLTTLTMNTGDDGGALPLTVKRFDSLQSNVRPSERIGKCRATESYAALSPMCMRYVMNHFGIKRLCPDNHLIVMLSTSHHDGHSCHQHHMMVKLYMDVSIGIVRQHYDEKDVLRDIYLNDHLMKQLKIEYGSRNRNNSRSSSTGDIVVHVERVVNYGELGVWRSVTLYPLSIDTSDLCAQYVEYCIHNVHFVRNGSIISIPANLFPDGQTTVEYYDFHVRCQPLFSSDIPDVNGWGYVDPLITMVQLEAFTIDSVSNHKSSDDSVRESARNEQTDSSQSAPSPPYIVVDDQEHSFESLIQYSLGSLQSINNHSRSTLRPPRSFLLHGPRGVGKSSMLQRISARINVKIRKLSPSDIYAQSFDSEQGLAHFGSEYERAVDMSPVLFVVDDLETLLPSLEFDKDRQLVSEFISILENAKPGACVIGVTSNVSSLDPFVRKKFDEEVFIDVPSTSERLELIKTSVRNLSHLCDPQLIEHLDTCAPAINMKCHGFVQSDIRTVFKSLHRQRAPPSSTPPLITLSDIVDAVRGHKPYSTKETSFSMVTPEAPDTKWDDIGGLSDIKQKLDEMIVWPMKYRHAYERMSIKPPTGLLLYGPPGTGKTLIAKAVATTSNANFISINIPDLIKSEIGESEKTLAKIFSRAKLSSPCVIFFDEIQAMFGDRRDVTKEQQKLISQLLLELDSVDDARSLAKNPINVILIAATNVPQNIDPSLLRPGRIEHTLLVGAPDAEARAAIFDMTLRKMRVTRAVVDRVPQYVSRTETYFTGADIVNICQQAGLSALCDSLSATQIEPKHFESAFAAVTPSITPTMIETYAKWKEIKHQRHD